MVNETRDYSATHNTFEYRIPVVRHEWLIDNIHGRQDGIGWQFNSCMFRVGSAQFCLEFRGVDPEWFFVYLRRVSSESSENRVTCRLLITDLLEKEEVAINTYAKNYTFTSRNTEVRITYFERMRVKGHSLRLTFDAVVYPEVLEESKFITSKHVVDSPDDLLKDFEDNLLTEDSHGDIRIVVPSAKSANVVNGGEGKTNNEIEGIDEKPTEFRAHRAILAARSPVFKAMFAEGSEFKEAKEGVLRIENFSPETVRAFLLFIYSGKIPSFEDKSHTELIELLNASDQYQIQALKTLCVCRLLALISGENAVELLTAAELFRAEELKRGAMRFIRDKIVRPGLADEGLKRLSPDLLFELLKSCSQGN